MGVFLEGVEAVAQPCTLPLLISALVFIFAAGVNAPIAAFAHLGGVAMMAWLRFTRLVTLDVTDGPAVVAGVIVAASAMAIAFAPAGRRRLFAGVGAALGGAVAAVVWRPCVGFELGSVLNDAPTDRVGTFIPVVLYVTGASLVSMVVALLPVAVPRIGGWMAQRWVSTGGAIMGVVLGLLMAVGVWSDLVDEMLRLSTA